MFLLLSLLLVISASVQSYDFQYNHNHMYTFCKDGGMNDFFCEPFFKYFLSVLKPFPTNDICKDCKNIIKDLSKEGYTTKVVENFIDTISGRFCESLKVEERESCKLWIKEHSEKIKTLTRNQIKTGKLCENLFKCKPTELKVKEEQSKDSLFPICNTCKQSIHEIEERFTGRWSFKGIVEVIYEYLCRYVPTNTFVDCIQLSQDAGFAFLQFIVRFQNSSRFCSDIHLCPPTPAYVSFDYKNVKSETICDFCKKTSTEEFETVKNLVTVKKLKEIGYKIFCHNSTENVTCKSFIDATLEILVDRFKNVINKDVVCYELLHCQKDINPPNSPFGVIYDTVSYQSKPSKSQCVKCNLTRNIMLKTLEDPRIVTIMEFVYINYVCKKEKENHLEKCLKTMKIEIPKIIRRVTAHLKNTSICNRVCSKSNYMDLYVSSKSCPFCKKLMTKLKNLVGPIRNEIYIGQKIRNICQTIPISEKKDCLRIVLDNENRIKSMLMNNEDVTHICTKLKKCSKSFYPYEMYFEDDSYLSKFLSSFANYYQDKSNMYDFKSFYYNSFPFKFFKSYSKHPYSFYDYKTPTSKNSYMKSSYPFEMFNYEMPDSYNSFEIKSVYPFIHKYFYSKPSFPFEYFGKQMSYPYKYFERMPKTNNAFEEKNSFPYHFLLNSQKRTLYCDTCRNYVGDLIVIWKKNLNNPNFWHKIVEELCILYNYNENMCREEIAAPFEAIMDKIIAGETVNDICKVECTD